MNEAIETWFKQAAAHPAVSACGVRASDRALHVKSYREELPEAHVTQALRDLSEALYALQQNKVHATRLRWTFEAGHILCVTGTGGGMAVLLVKKGFADDPGIERLLAGSPLAAS